MRIKDEKDNDFHKQFKKWKYKTTLEFNSFTASMHNQIKDLEVIRDNHDEIIRKLKLDNIVF